CIDISNTQGQDTMASLVVFEDGLPRKRDYRSYAVRTVTADDPAAIAEVISRRFRNFGAQSSVDDDDDLVHRAYPPGLVLVDGGAPQVAAAAKALADLQITEVPVAGLAKRLEELWLPGAVEPVILARGSEALYLVQRVRDEAHRMAIRLHRHKRGRRMGASALDTVPGLGPRRAQALLKKFGSVRRIKSASLDELCEVPGIGQALAKAIQANLSED
ncbi:MAG: helix-hairpin-helix domain-containing protein, partial [Actinomycetales bacterium]